MDPIADVDADDGEDRVETRASGRPPEEADSDDPEHQARVILEESDRRVADGKARSERR